MRISGGCHLEAANSQLLFKTGEIGVRPFWCSPFQVWWLTFLVSAQAGCRSSTHVPMSEVHSSSQPLYMPAVEPSSNYYFNCQKVHNTKLEVVAGWTKLGQTEAGLLLASSSTLQGSQPHVPRWYNARNQPSLDSLNPKCQTVSKQLVWSTNHLDGLELHTLLGRLLPTAETLQ